MTQSVLSQIPRVTGKVPLVYPTHQSCTIRTSVALLCRSAAPYLEIVTAEFAAVTVVIAVVVIVTGIVSIIVVIVLVIIVIVIHGTGTGLLSSHHGGIRSGNGGLRSDNRSGRRCGP